MHYTIFSMLFSKIEIEKKGHGTHTTGDDGNGNEHSTFSDYNSCTFIVFVYCSVQ